MTNNNHSITPSPELVYQWADEHFASIEWIDNSGDASGIRQAIAIKAARWGADQELEACCEWMAQETPEPYINALRAARRPKPPSLKQQALVLINGCTDPHGDHLDDVALDIIRRALEALPD